MALLRGINVGGNSIISMTDLKACFEAIGLTNVKTYINSGNVVFASATTDQRDIEASIEAALTSKFALNIRVVVYSSRQIEQIMRVAPKNWQDNDSIKRNVIFLHHSIDSPKILESLKPKPGIEELSYHPGVLFWSAKTSDLTKSNMVKLSRSPLFKAMTVRGLNTLVAIHKIIGKISVTS